MYVINKMRFKKSNNFIFLCRFSIYMIGLFIISFFIFINVAQKNKESFNFHNDTVPNNLQFTVPSTEKYENVKIMLDLNNGTLPKEFAIKMTKTLSPLMREKASMITTKEGVNDVIGNEDYLKYMNGSILKYKESYYFVERGATRKIANHKIFDILGIKKQEIPTTDETILHIEQDDEITITSLKNNFPRGTIIDANGDLFIVGANRIHPLLSEELINRKQANSSRQPMAIAKLVEDKDLEHMQCFKDSPNRIYCEIEPDDKNSTNAGDIILFKIFGVKKENVLNLDVTVTKNAPLSKIKSLLW